jgi:hypothetical protein
VQRLHNAHRRPTGPVQLAGGRPLEINGEFVEMNGAATRIRVDHNV